MFTAPEPFTVAVDEAVLDDLRARLVRTRWPDDLGNQDWSYGANAAYLRDFCDYWAHSYDWPAQAASINAFSHYRVTIDGLPIHYVHLAGDGPDRIPILLLHGWPWSFWDFRQLVECLRGDGDRSFDIVIPSLPGFVWSTPLPRTGVSFVDTADAFVTLMTDVLEYPRFAIHASDFGGIVAAQLGHKYADRVIALHTTAPGRPDFIGGDRPWDIGGPPPPQLPADLRDIMLRWQAGVAAHVAVHVLDPQSLSYGPHDSPAALAAWILNRRYHYSDCHGRLENSFSRDDLCTLLTLYWASECFVSSVRYYREAALTQWRPSHDRTPLVEAPTGVSHFTVDLPAEMMPEWLISQTYNLVYYQRYETGGHFAAAESPDVIAADIGRTIDRASRR